MAHGIKKSGSGTTSVTYPDAPSKSLTKHKGSGRISSYNEEVHVPLAQAIAMLGGTDEICAKLLGIDRSSLYRWKAKYPLFREAIESGKEAQDKTVENALLKRAQGFTEKEEFVSAYKGEVTKTKINRYYPPDTKAAEFWLKNRQGKYWKERHEVKHEGELVMLNFDKADEDL